MTCIKYISLKDYAHFYVCMYLNPLLRNSAYSHCSFETSNYVQDSIFMVVMEGHAKFKKKMILIIGYDRQTVPCDILPERLNCSVICLVMIWV